MRQHLVRIVYALVSLIGAYLAYYFHDNIVSDNSNFNNFSYWGSVATFIGLMITVAEVIHNTCISKSIQKEAKSLLQKVKLIENASSISDCLAAIDDVSSSVAQEDYSSALKSFRFFRKICVKVIPDFDDSKEKKLGNLGEIELVLTKSISATRLGDSLSKPQKTDLMKKVLLVKQNIEKNNPARGEPNVTN